MIVMLVNGVDVASSPGVVLHEGRLFAPVRAQICRLVDRVSVSDDRSLVISRGTQSLRIRVGSRAAWNNGLALQLKAAPYQSGGDVMIPLSDIVHVFHERLHYDARHSYVAVTVPSARFTTTFVSVPPSHVIPTEIFTPRPTKTPQVVSTPVAFPRRTPIPVHLDPADPPL